MIGERLRNIRESKGLSMEEVSNSTGITNSRLSKIERGITKHPTLNDISILLELYGVPLIAFLASSVIVDRSREILSGVAVLSVIDRLVLAATANT